MGPAPEAAEAAVVPADAPAIVSTAAGTLDLFWRTEAGGLRQQNFRDGSWSAAPRPLDGKATHGPGAAGDPRTGTLLMAMVGEGSQVYYRTRTGQTWTPWLPLEGKSNEQPAVASLGGGSFAVVVTGTDGRAFVRTLRAGKWNAWSTLGGRLSAGPAAAGMAGGGLVVAGVGTDSQTFTLTISGAGVPSSWSRVGGQTLTTPGIAVDPGDGRWHLVIRDGVEPPSGYVVERVYSPAARSWSAWTNLEYFQVESGVAIVAPAAGALDIVTTMLPQEWSSQNHYGAGSWSGWKRVAPINTTELVSASSNGVKGNGASTMVTVNKADDTAFESEATNLVAGDTNGRRDVFLRSDFVDSVSRVSLANDGAQANGSSAAPDLSSTSQYIVFESQATNLVEGDTNARTDIFLRNRYAETTVRVSLTSEGAQSDADSRQPSISADGRHVAFLSAAQLVPEDVNSQEDVYVRDLTAGTTRLVSAAADGKPGNDRSSSAEISADGTVVAFGSSASNLVVGDTNNAHDAFARNLATGVTTRVSVGTGGAQADASLGRVSVSANGRYVTFLSKVTNLVPGDTNGVQDAFLYDRDTATTSRVSIGSGSAGAQANAAVVSAAISENGFHIVFDTTASNLVPGDTNGVNDVFRRELLTSRTVRASVASTGTPVSGASDSPSIAPDGHTIAFRSDASDLAPGDSDSAPLSDVFLYRY